MNKTVRIIVSGKVQGVSFRFYTRNQAKELGIFGYVRNLSNGDVEIVAQGEKTKLDKLINWCYSGSPSAIVRDVKLEVLTESIMNSTDFSIQY
ncbi:acylphosphatase [Cyanobacterium aponinum]|uniref:Acylphosphatase n=1 Tax=Cyanobacterium aponinum 0216 TaxID=2676140 RepID=A0A844GV51_9CHRO|nr:acylphosphatase [Cyanobacterium aponinum]MTF40337.1 acylphosphatase [Cyanobacterium aponinum 0216]